MKSRPPLHLFWALRNALYSVLNLFPTASPCRQFQWATCAEVNVPSFRRSRINEFPGQVRRQGPRYIGECPPRGKYSCFDAAQQHWNTARHSTRGAVQRGHIERCFSRRRDELERNNATNHLCDHCGISLG